MNENMKTKLDVSLAENDELNRKLQDAKKKEAECDRLRKLVDQLSEANRELQRGQQELKCNLEVHKSSNTDLRKVIQRLDSELKRERSQLLRNKGGAFYDNSLFEGFVDDEFIQEVIGIPKTKSVPSFGQVQKIAVQDVNEELKK